MASLTLEGSVGTGGQNLASDIKAVQTALNLVLDLIPPTQTLAVDGSLGKFPEKSNTVAAIKLFQKNVVGLANPDGRIDVNGRTHKKLNEKLAAIQPANTSTRLPEARGTKDLNEKAYVAAAQSLDCEVAAIKAVAEVESSGSSFLDSKRPAILFEAHIFSRETERAYDESHPDISTPRWTRSLYEGGEKEYDRLKKAMALNRTAALRSASWGKFQIMGFNHEAAGLSTIESFVKAMFESESRHLMAFVEFLKSEKLDVYLKTKNWAKFAKGYNGSSYAENKYDIKLKAAYEKYAEDD